VRPHGAAGRRDCVAELRRGAGTRRPARAGVRRGGLERPHGGAEAPPPSRSGAAVRRRGVPCSELRRVGATSAGLGSTAPARVWARAGMRLGETEVHKGGAAVEEE